MEFRTHEEMLDRHIGKKGTPKRDEFDAMVEDYKEELLNKYMSDVKTWSDVEFLRDIQSIDAYIDPGYVTATRDRSPIEKAAIALLKINYLIEHYYGGNATHEDWLDESIIKYYISPAYDDLGKYYVECTRISAEYRHIAFHTREQAEEFLKYPENIQLLKDYFLNN